MVDTSTTTSIRTKMMRMITMKIRNEGKDKCEKQMFPVTAELVFLCLWQLKCPLWPSLSSALINSKPREQPNKSACSPSSPPFSPLTKSVSRQQPRGIQFLLKPQTGALMTTWDVALTGEQRDFIGVRPCRDFLAFTEAELPELCSLLWWDYGVKAHLPN